MQLKVSLSTGRTLTFDLLERPQEWAKVQGDPGFQASIRSLALSHRRTLHTLPLPVKFRAIAFQAEVLYKKPRQPDGPQKPASARIGCIADDVMVWLTVYYGEPPVIRVDVKKVGRPRFQPAGRSMPVVRES